MNKKNVIAVVIALTCIALFNTSCKRSTIDEDDRFKGEQRMTGNSSIKVEATEAISTPEVLISPNSWNNKATILQNDLMNLYWDNEAKRMTTDTDNKLHYWWQAHVIDVMFDGYERTEDVIYANRAKAVYESVYNLNSYSFANTFYDDMEWMALALLRGYQLTGDEAYKKTVLELWEIIKLGWSDDSDGGIAWQFETPAYKNTPANMPAAILATRLYKEFGNEVDLGWAHKIYQWQIDHLIDLETGIVWDGMNRNGDGNVDKDWLFTYCQGIFIGASVELYEVTGDSYYLNLANKTAIVAMDKFSEPSTGILMSEGSGDAGLFRGIFIRYFTQLTLLDQKKEYTNFLVKNGESLWKAGRDPITGALSKYWEDKPFYKDDLSVQLSGIMLLESVAKLEQRGTLE